MHTHYSLTQPTPSFPALRLSFVRPSQQFGAILKEEPKNWCALTMDIFNYKGQTYYLTQPDVTKFQEEKRAILQKPQRQGSGSSFTEILGFTKTPTLEERLNEFYEKYVKQAQ
jgi:hypothetical protein